MLNYKVQGEGHPIVLLHGYLESMMMWDEFADELSKEYKVIRMDMPGHGLSPGFGEVHTMQLMAKEVNNVLDSLGVSQALVIGHSMGGYVTMELVHLFQNKVKAFILMNSSTLADTPEKKELRLRAVETAQKSFDALVKMSVPLLFNENNFDNLHPQMEFARNMARQTPLYGVTAALKGMRIRFDRSVILDKFPGKIGVILGKFDKTVDPVPFKKVIPEATEEKDNITVLEQDTGHMAYLEAPAGTLEFIKKFAKDTFKVEEAAG